MALRVPLSNFKNALKLSDAEVIFIEIREKWNGDIVEKILCKLFANFGLPLQIIMDGGSDLKKGTKQLLMNIETPIKLTYDLTHFIANLLKNKYHKNSIFKEFMTKLADARKRAIQTSLSYIIPPKQRSKARFLNLPELTKWLQDIIFLLKNKTQIKHEQIKENFGWILDYEIFLRGFCKEIITLQNILEILKNFGLNKNSYNKVLIHISSLINGEIKNSIQNYLEEEYKFFQKSKYSVLLTSDIIESLFGKYKYLAKPHCLSEINRLILLLPCICNKMTPNLIKECFKKTSTKDVNKWIVDQASDTLLSKRRKAFGGTNKNVSIGQKSAGAELTSSA